MTRAEVRGSVLAYYRIKEIENHPFPDPLKQVLAEFCCEVEKGCTDFVKRAAATRWACGHLGPVLSAAVAAAYPTAERHNYVTSVLKAFGLAGERSLSSPIAWRIMLPYVHEPVVSEQVVAKIARDTSLRLRPHTAPTPVELLAEMTRPRGGKFPVQVGKWLAEKIQEMPIESHYGALYQKTLDEFTSLNATGENAQYISSHVHGEMNREDWVEVLNGRIPRHRLEARASYATARQFISDYCELWRRSRH